MGFIGNLSSRIRAAFRRDKARVAMQISRGATSPSAHGAYDLLQSYGHNSLSEYLKQDQDILMRYVDYEEMNDYPLIFSALNIMADDASQTDIRTGHTTWVKSPSERISEIGDHLFHKVLRLDEEQWEMARSLAHFGNLFEEILVTQEGVIGLNSLPAPTMRRIEGPRGELFGFIQDFQGKLGYTEDDFKKLLEKRNDPSISVDGGTFAGNADYDQVIALEDWEVMHCRLKGGKRRARYGISTLEGSRWIWKRLTLLEDASFIYRLQRSPERFAYYVDIGDLPPPEAMGFLNKVRQQNKKKKYVDSSGRLNLKYDIIAPSDDIYIPVRKGIEGARVEVLGAPAYQQMDDIQYFRDMMFASLSIPKAYLGMEEGVVRSVLSQQDVRFCRAILRLQQELKNGYGKILRAHLAALGIDPFSEDYQVVMTIPSSIFELAQIEAENAKADLAQRMGEHVSEHWILSRIFGFSDDDIELMFKQKKEDAVRLAEYQAEAQAKMQEIAGAAMQDQGAPAGPQGPEQGSPPGQSGSPKMPPPPSQQQIFQSVARKYGVSIKANGQPYRTAITERQLYDGNRESEKRAELKLEKLLKNDTALTERLKNLNDLLHDLRAAIPQKRSTTR